MTTQNVPGVTIGRTATPRRILKQAARDLIVQEGVTINGTLACDGLQSTGYEKYIRAGSLLGKITATGLMVPLKRTKTNGAGAATATLVVDNSSFFQLGDTVTVGASASTTILSIVHSTNTITLAATRTWGDNEVVIATDGSGTARGILLDDEVRLWNEERTAAANMQAQMLIAGYVQKSLVLGDLNAALEDPQHKLGKIVFDDEYLSTFTPPTSANLGWKQVSAAADMTLTAADSGLEIFATAAVNITLPAVASAGQGFRIRAHQTAAATLTITAPAGLLIALNNAAATSVAYSTGSQQIGAGVEIVLLPNMTKYKASNISAGVQAVTVA